MLKDTEQSTKKPLDLDFQYLHGDDKEKVMNKIKKEKKMDAKQLVIILENYLKEQGFLTIREKNYVGYNEAPFDLTAGCETSLKMWGFEIKSDKDTFERLQRQLQHYSFVCQEIYIVLHKKEIPKWLPDWVGVIRITDKGEIYEESHAYNKEPFEISTGYAWDIIAKENGIAGNKDKLQEIFNELIAIRKNILFNHYFAIQYDSTTNNSLFKRFFPITDKQKRFIMGLNIEYQMKELKLELKRLEKRFNTIKQLMNIDNQSKLECVSDKQEVKEKKDG